jgi:hypothetical protein
LDLSLMTVVAKACTPELKLKNETAAPSGPVFAFTGLMPWHTRLLKYLARRGFEILFVAVLVFPSKYAIQ